MKQIDYKNLDIILICHFGLEKVLKNEVKKLGIPIKEVVDGEVKVIGELSDIPRLNYNLRTCERVMIEVDSFTASEPDELYYNAMESEIEKFVPQDGEFIITKANQDKNSKLRSAMANQKTVKKAFVERLKKVYKVDVLSESNGKYPFRIKFNKNLCSIRLDTTGDSLHKRGYRIKSGLAPIEETLAAALVMLTQYDGNKVFIDPFCGSGTIPIEAAMIVSKMPPSVDRAFVSETWDIIGKDLWEKALVEAKSNTYRERIDNGRIKIFGFDIDKSMIDIARDNAKRAGVADLIHFETCAAKDFCTNPMIRDVTGGIILCNPPYGERLMDEKSISEVYEELKYSYDRLSNFDLYVITPFEKMNRIFGKETKNRKIYNGMIKTYLYSYLNPSNAGNARI